MITALASAAAAYTCSKLWAPGTLLSAAFTPVLVAVIKDVIKRPAEVVTRTPRARGGAPAPADEPLEAGDWTPVARSGTHGAARRPASSSSPRWRLAIITGLLGFVLCAAVLTIPELVAGGSAAGGGRQTTLFGGHSTHSRHGSTTPTTASPSDTVTTPQRTVPAPTRTAPTPTTPAPATTPPASTTTAPAQPAPAAP